MSLFHRATFFTTAAKLGNLTFNSRAEVAFAGRSNAGKSSAINTLANQKRMAFTSKTPGRTQQLNYFALGEDRYLVDLPGYGYAKVSRSERERWGEFLGRYLQIREPLTGLVLIMDSRHPLTELDLQMLAWFAPTEKPVHALLTKSDKLSKLECADTLRKVTAEMQAMSPLYSASLFSSLKKTGLEEAEQAILPWFDVQTPYVPPVAGSEATAARREPEREAPARVWTARPEEVRRQAKTREGGTHDSKRVDTRRREPDSGTVRGAFGTGRHIGAKASSATPAQGRSARREPVPGRPVPAGARRAARPPELDPGAPRKRAAPTAPESRTAERASETREPVVRAKRRPYDPSARNPAPPRPTTKPGKAALRAKPVKAYKAPKKDKNAKTVKAVKAALATPKNNILRKNTRRI
jgi:GTP-binding protein